MEARIRILLTEPYATISASEETEELLGYRAEDFLAGHVSLKNLIHADDQDIADDLFAPDPDASSGTFNIRLRHADGRVRCVKGHYRKTRDDTGANVMLELGLQDAKSLWQRRTADSMTAEFKAMMENTDDFIYFKDRNHVFTGASQTLVSVTDPSEHWTDLLGHTDYDVFPEEYADLYYKLEKQVFAGTEVAQEIQETLDVKGNKGWVDNRKYPLRDEHGNITGLFGIARIITQQRRAEQALRESELTLRESQLIAGLGSYVLDLGSEIWKSSDVLDQLLGIDPSYDHSAAGLLALVHPNDRAVVEDMLRNEVIVRRKDFLKEFRIVRRTDRAERWVRAIGRLEFDTQGQPRRLRGTIQDVTESRENMLAERRAILGNQMVGVVAVRNQKVVWANSAFEALLGYGGGELIGAPARLFYADEEDYLQGITACEGIAGTEVVHTQQKYVRKDGTRIWLDKSAALLHKETGEFLWTFIDVTERKRAEEAVRESESRFRIMADHAPVLIWIAGLDKRCYWFNKVWLDFTGRSLDQEKGDGWIDSVHPDDFRHCLDTYVTSFDARQEFAMEYRLRRFDGEYRWILDHGVPRFDDQGVFLGYIGSCIDITERKAAEQALAASESKFRRFFEHNSSVMLLIEPASNCIVDANQAAVRYYGYPLKQLIGMPIGNINSLPPERLIEEKQRAVREECNYFIFSHRLATGEVRDVEVHSTPIESEGRLLLLSIVHDITERIQLEQRIAEKINELSVIIDNSSVGISLVRKRTLIWANRRMAEIFGYAGEEITSQSTRMFFTSQEEFDSFGNKAYLVLAVGERYSLETEMRHRDGHRIWISLSGKAISPDDQSAGSIWVFEDVTERKRAEKNLQLAASVFTNANEGIVITVPNGTIIEVNDAFTRITGYKRDEVLGKNPRLLSSGREGKEFYAEMWRSLIEKGHWHGEIWNRRRNGEVYAEKLAIEAVCDASGVVQHYVGMFSDITVLKEHERQLERIAHYDALTNLPNRVLLADRLHLAMAQAQRRGDRLAVAYLDLDGFKAINDSYGHEVGDQLLVGVTSHLRQEMRESDTLARIGGDEFVAVLPDVGDDAENGRLFTRLLTAAARPVGLSGLTLQVSASLGVTFYQQSEGVDADQLLRQADQAMYQAKLAGKSRYSIFDAEHDRSIRGYHESLERIRQALAHHEFVLYYQPKVNMRSGTATGAEALIRWQHPESGLLPPGVFLPLIEDHPLAVELGEWVIDAALTQMETWQSAGLDIPVSVNIGARQLQQPEFVDRLRGILARHGSIKPSSIELEVLETSALEDLAYVTETIAACRELGVAVALDDFGTGYSSLIYLKHLPVTLLKIDQSFVRDMLVDPDDLAILEGVIGLAAAFRRKVIAEGVETREHGELLLQLGCELGQGYGIARPMPAAQIPAWVASWCPHDSWRNQPLVHRKDLPLIFAGVEHRAWMADLESHLQGGRGIPPLMDHKQCHFGQWLETEGLNRSRVQSDIREIDAVHRQVHAMAAQVLALHAQGHTRQVEALLGELHARSEVMLAQLKRMVTDSR
ncbi:PAS domain S-box protein [Methylococcus sp. EFPC2]|uniref:PAS domain S-box protein n=1 Tax=Methylococcus sp. EFPC2 TaxID=2812648 RepID=UPI00196770CA|nr:PAS domain S-box protein [Methylococcus sp. EFPC2]QSA96911.1 PAS domain S-box protein [Methylococcus sp. EFPC2]